MNDMPRQEDLKMATMEGSSRYNSVSLREPLPEDSDVYVLLAFANYVQSDRHRYTALERLTPLDADNQPLHSPTRQPSRLAKVLDSLAHICVSQSQNEVFAVAVRLHNAENLVNVFIASNSTVPQTTKDYLVKIWNIMKDLSEWAATTIPGYSNLLRTPTRIVQDDRVVGIVKQLEIEVIKFTFKKIQKRITSKVHDFLSIPADDLTSEHPFRCIREYIELLDQHFMRTAAPDDEEFWSDLRTILNATRESFQELFENRNSGTWAFGQDRADCFPGYEGYLKKVISAIADVEILTRAAISPQCRPIFKAGLVLESLPQELVSVNYMPESCDEWETALERPLAFYNHFTRPSLRRTMDIHRVRRDCEHIANHSTTSNAPIHCELKLLLHLHRKYHHRAYSYIGVSELSCLGCFSFISAFNHIFQTRFLVKGTHSKAYWPWGLPDCGISHEGLRNVLYRKLTEHWVPSYDGYVAEKVPLAPDSTAQSGPSDGPIINEDISDKVQALKRKLRAEHEK